MKTRGIPVSALMGNPNPAAHRATMTHSGGSEGGSSHSGPARLVVREPEAVAVRHTDMTQAVRRWLLPLVAAAAVLAVVAVVWAQRPGASGGDAGVAAGAGDPGSPGAGSPPYAGSEPSARSEPGDRGLDTPIPVPDLTVTPKPTASAPRHLIGINSYYRYDARHLALNYTNGVPECYGTAGEPRVEETPKAVVVTIPRVPPEPADENVACIDIAVQLSVDITLEEPLGDRVVRDRSRDGAKLPEADRPFSPRVYD